MTIKSERSVYYISSGNMYLYCYRKDPTQELELHLDCQEPELLPHCYPTIPWVIIKPLNIEFKWKYYNFNILHIQIKRYIDATQVTYIWTYVISICSPELWRVNLLTRTVMSKFWSPLLILCSFTSVLFINIWYSCQCWEYIIRK